MRIKQKTKDRIEYFLKKELADGFLVTMAWLGVVGLQYYSVILIDYVVYSTAIVGPIVIFAMRKIRKRIRRMKQEVVNNL